MSSIVIGAFTCFGYFAAGLAAAGLLAGLAVPRDAVACRAFFGPLRVRALVRVR
jgi:hypothetical protein